MLSKKYEAFRQEVKKHLAGLRGRKITEIELDDLAGAVLADTTQDLPDKIYCRDGFGYVNKLDADHYQLVGFQVNSFGAGIFGPDAVRFGTPVLLDVQVLAKRRNAPRTLQETPLAVTDFFLGKKFSGSKGPLCDREKFLPYTRDLLLSDLGRGSCYQQLVYKLMNANYVCHHIAEALGYALGALDIFWKTGQTHLFMSAGSHFNERRDKLHIEIIEDFTGDRMRSYLEVPHYVKLMEDIKKFKEEFDTLILEVTYRGETESFYLPVGYQKVVEKRRHESVNIITTQHVVQHLLKDYYKRENAYVVSSTFQTLEYLSRGFIARKEGRPDECAAFLRQMTTCMGYYPERDFDDFRRKKETGYDTFEDEFEETMFFRPPVLE